MKNNAKRAGLAVHGMKPVMLLCVVGPLLVSGCMSQRVTTNLKPETNAELKSPAGQFYVAGLKYAWAMPNGAMDKELVAKAEQHLLPLVRKECTSRYPALFMDDASSSAIPLAVELNCTTTMHQGKTIAWMLCTLDICGTILPAPGDTDEDFDVKVGVWNGRDGIGGVPLKNSFQRQEHVWVSVFSPAALITIPGESDFPKMSGTVFGIQEQMELSYQQTAQQVATALAQLVATKEPGFWVVPVGNGNSPTALSSAPTTTLPPPTESAAPF
jgi:hypothetical protein